MLITGTGSQPAEGTTGDMQLTGRDISAAPIYKSSGIDHIPDQTVVYFQRERRYVTVPNTIDPTHLPAQFDWYATTVSEKTPTVSLFRILLPPSSVFFRDLSNGPDHPLVELFVLTRSFDSHGEVLRGNYQYYTTNDSAGALSAKSETPGAVY